MWDDVKITDTGRPIWTRIADRLRYAIVAGQFAPGALLPGESELNRRFGVSRTTSRAALNQLRAEGLIARYAGRGSVVLPTRIERRLDKLSSFSEDMQDRGYTPSWASPPHTETNRWKDHSERTQVRRTRRPHPYSIAKGLPRPLVNEPLCRSRGRRCRLQERRSVEDVRPRRHPPGVRDRGSS